MLGPPAAACDHAGFARAATGQEPPVHFPRVESHRLFWEGASAADGWGRHSRIPGASRGDVGTMTVLPTPRSRALVGSPSGSERRTSSLQSRRTIRSSYTNEK